MSELTLAELGLAETQTSQLSSEHAALVAATFDASPPNDVLPFLWHWTFFNPVAPTAGLGADGHPTRVGATLAQFPRRMWVGGDVHTTDLLRLDVPAVRRTRLLSGSRKSGSTGDLLLVSLEHTIEQNSKVVVTERQDVIYRTAGASTPPPGPPANLAALPADWVETVTPDPRLLFRFSAVTFNTHRIHYDRPYTTGDEGYPDLVVHGPLTAMLLAASAERALRRRLTSLSFRASAPLFVDQPITITGTLNDDTASLTATRTDGATAMTATAA